MKISCSICCWLMAFLKLLLHLHFSNRTKLDKKWKELPSQRSTERLKRATTDNNQSFVLARRTWDETPVERKLRELFQRYGFTVKFLEDISRDFYKGLFFVGEIGGFPSRLGIISLTQNLFFMRWLASAHHQKPTWWTSQIKGRNAHQIANYTTTVFWLKCFGRKFFFGLDACKSSAKSGH